MLVLLFEVGNDFRASQSQIRDVAIAVEWYPSLPNSKEYSDPAAGTSSEGAKSGCPIGTFSRTDATDSPVLATSSDVRIIVHVQSPCRSNPPCWSCAIRRAM